MDNDNDKVFDAASVAMAAAWANAWTDPGNDTDEKAMDAASVAMAAEWQRAWDNAEGAT